MWKLLDKLDSQFNKQYTIQDIYDEIEEKLSIYKLDNNYATKTDLERFKRYILKHLSILSINTRKEAKTLLNRSKISNNDIVRFIIKIIYDKKQKELDEYENLIVKELVKDTIEKESKEYNLELRPTYVEFAFFLLSLPNARGYKWKEYNLATMNYNADETFRHILINGTKGLKDLLTKQKRRIINKKKDQDQQDKYSGAFDEEMVGIINQIKVKLYQDNGIDKCKFISVIDNKTTKMCSGLNNQEFYLDKYNKYYRYSEIDKKDVLYTTLGMKLGENLPPINNHFHWCRSTIKPILEKYI